MGLGENNGVRVPPTKVVRKYGNIILDLFSSKQGTQWRENKSIKLCISELEKLGSGPLKMQFIISMSQSMYLIVHHLYAIQLMSTTSSDISSK